MDQMRRTLTAGLAALPALSLFGRATAAAEPLKISHQFPSGSATEGDFRDQLCRRFAAAIEKKSGGALTGQVYPGSSLMKVNSQFSALRKGALDLSLVPISYSGGEVPEVNIGLMPALVPSYEVARAWKNAEVGRSSRRSSTTRASSSSAGSGRPAASRAATVSSSRPRTRRA